MDKAWILPFSDTVLPVWDLSADADDGLSMLSSVGVLSMVCKNKNDNVCYSLYKKNCFLFGRLHSQRISF